MSEKKAQAKLPMSSLDVGASVDEMRHLCVGMQFSSIAPVSTGDAKDTYEIRFVDGSDERRQSASYSFLASAALGENVAVADAGLAPEFHCLRKAEVSSNTSCTNAISSCTLIVSPFASVSGLRCHLRDIEVTRQVRLRSKVKLSKNRFSDEVSTFLRNTFLVNVLQVAHDRVVAFQFSDSIDPASTFSHSACMCRLCENRTALLAQAVLSSSTEMSLRVPTTKFTLYVELFAGNMVLVDSESRIVSVQVTKPLSADDVRRREKGMEYLPYFHNNVAPEALESIATVVQCASVLSSSLLYDADAITVPTPSKFVLGVKSPLQSLPTISAQFALEVFRERSTWSASCCASPSALLALRDSLSESGSDTFSSSLDIISARLRSHLDFPQIDPLVNTFFVAFDNIFSGFAQPGSFLGDALEEIEAAAPAASPNASAVRQQSRCFSFTSTISNSNSISHFYSGIPSKRDHTSAAALHFSECLIAFLNKFSCRLASTVEVPMTKVLVAFLTGIPINGYVEQTFSSPQRPIYFEDGAAGGETVRSKPFDFSTLGVSAGDDVFESLRRCLGIFDNMGPVLATHCLNSAWDDARTSKLNYQRGCQNAASALVRRYGVDSHSTSFLERSIPCPPIEVVASASADTQFAFLTVLQCIQESAENATLQIPKNHHGGNEVAPLSMLRSLASIRLQQRMLNSLNASDSSLFNTINTDATEEAALARTEAGSALANALMAPNIPTNESSAPHLTVKTCVESIFEALPPMPSIETLTDSLCSHVISQLLAPYVADTCVLLHHPFRQNGDTFIQSPANGKWVWAGHSYSPLSAGGVVYFGERTALRAPPTFVSEEMKQMKRLMHSETIVTGSSEGLLPDAALPERWAEVGTPNTELGVVSAAVLAFADGAEPTDAPAADSFETECSPTLDVPSSRRAVSFSPGVANSDPVQKTEAREDEQRRLRVFTEQQVVLNPFATDDSTASRPAQSMSDLDVASSRLSASAVSFDFYFPALSPLSDMSVSIRDNVDQYRQGRRVARMKYEDLALKLENSKAYVAAACRHPFLRTALGFTKSSLRQQSPDAAKSPTTYPSPVTLVGGGGDNEILSQRLEELESKKNVVDTRANRLFVLPSLSPIGDNCPLRPPSHVSSSFQVCPRIGINSCLPIENVPPCASSLPGESVFNNRSGVAEGWPLQAFVDSLLNGDCAPDSLALLRGDSFDFSPVGRALEYYYAALARPRDQSATAHGSNLTQVPCILSARQTSEHAPKVLSLASGKGKAKATDLVENTMRKHEARKANLENTAQGYRINGNTLIAFADIVNVVLGQIASVVSQGSSWTSIESTFNERRRLLLEQVSAAERVMMAERGFEGRYDEYLDRKYQWEEGFDERKRASKEKQRGADASYMYSDEDDEFDEDEPVEDEELDLIYYFENQDAIDPSPKTKDELIERLFGCNSADWLFRVISSLNLTESSVVVSLPKVVDDDVPLEREPEMIDIEVMFTETAYANANLIFKRKKEVEVKVSKAHQADDLVREGAKRRALQRQVEGGSGARPKKSSRHQELAPRKSFRDDLLYREAQDTLKKIPPLQRSGNRKRVIVPIPHFVENPFSSVPSPVGSLTVDRSRSSNDVPKLVSDPILFQNGHLIVPEIDHVKGIAVLEDFQDPLGEFGCKSFWFLSSPSDVVAVPCDPSLTWSITVRSSFLVLHPRDATGAVKLLGEELSKFDVVVYTSDPQAEGALPVVIKSRTITVKTENGPVMCRLSVSSAALGQAASMLFARSKMWVQRCTGAAFWCYGSQLVVRTKSDRVGQTSNLSLVPPLVVPAGASVRSSDFPATTGGCTVTIDCDTLSIVAPVQMDMLDEARCSQYPHHYSVSFTCYFFDIVRGRAVEIPASSQPLRLGIGLMFREQVPDDIFASDKVGGSRAEPLDTCIPSGSCSFTSLMSELSRSAVLCDSPDPDSLTQRVADAVRQKARKTLWSRQEEVRSQLRSGCSELPFTEDLKTHRPADGGCVAPFSDALLSEWSCHKATIRRVHVSAPSKSEPNASRVVSTGSDAVLSQSDVNPFAEVLAALKGLVSADNCSSVSSIMKFLKTHQELGLQQLLLYLVVHRKSKTLTSEERAREAQRKKDAAKNSGAQQLSKGKQSEKKEKKKIVTKGSRLPVDDPPKPAVATARSDVEIVSAATAMSKAYVENAEKDLKRQVKQTESELVREQFSESESEEECGPARARSAKKGARSAPRSMRHTGLRMLIADEILKAPAMPSTTESIKKGADVPRADREAATACVPVSMICRDVCFSETTSKLDDCWDRELRWLTGNPQHTFAVKQPDGSFSTALSSVSYCIPVIAPVQSFVTCDGGESRFKYFVELQPSGQEKSSSRIVGQKRDSSNGKKGSLSNFKSVFDSFIHRVSDSVTTSYRNDYWPRFLQMSQGLSNGTEANDDFVDITIDFVNSLAECADQFAGLERTVLISSDIEAAVMERVSQNSTKYFQRLWDVSISVSEMVCHPLRAVVRAPSFTIPNIREISKDSSLADLLSGRVAVANLDLNFSERNELGRIDFNSCISSSLSGAPNSAFGAFVDLRKK